MNNICWICGVHADSGEHRMKQSNMKTLFGKNRKNDLLFLQMKIKFFHYSRIYNFKKSNGLLLLSGN